MGTSDAAQEEIDQYGDICNGRFVSTFTYILVAIALL